MISDWVLDALHKRINAIADMCNEQIRPWEPDSGPRAVRRCNEIAKPYIEALNNYIATRPKSALPVPWCNALEDLVQFGYIEFYLD